MAEAIKNSNGATNLGAVPSAEEFNLLTLQQKQKDKQREQTAALLAQLEEFAESMLQEQESQGQQQTKAGPNEGSTNQTEGAPSDDLSSSKQKFGGSNFFVSNNIPFEMFVDMMQERLKQLNTQSETQQMIALAYAGKNKDVGEDGSVTYSDQAEGGIVDMLCSTIIEGATQDSLKTMLSATQAISQGAGSLSGLFGLVSGGNIQKEQGEVDRLTNAIEAEKLIPESNNVIVGDKTARAAAANKDQGALDDAVAALKDGTCYDKLQLGSVKSESGREGSKIASYKAAELDDLDYLAQEQNIVNKNPQGQDDASLKVTTEDALKYAEPLERRAIRATMQKKLDIAKEALTVAEGKVQQVRKAIMDAAAAAGTAASGGVKTQEAAIDLEKGRQNALQQSDQSIQSTLSKIADNQGKAVDNRKNAIDQATQDLQKIISTVGQRG